MNKTTELLAKNTLRKALKFAHELRQLVIKHGLDTETVMVTLGPAILSPDGAGTTSVGTATDKSGFQIVLASWKKGHSLIIDPDTCVVVERFFDESKPNLMAEEIVN